MSNKQLFYIFLLLSFFVLLGAGCGKHTTTAASSVSLHFDSDITTIEEIDIGGTANGCNGIVKAMVVPVSNPQLRCNAFEAEKLKYPFSDYAFDTSKSKEYVFNVDPEGVFSGKIRLSPCVNAVLAQCRKDASEKIDSFDQNNLTDTKYISLDNIPPRWSQNYPNVVFIKNRSESHNTPIVKEEVLINFAVLGLDTRMYNGRFLYMVKACYESLGKLSLVKLAGHTLNECDLFGDKYEYFSTPLSLGKNTLGLVLKDQFDNTAAYQYPVVMVPKNSNNDLEGRISDLESEIDQMKNKTNK